MSAPVVLRKVEKPTLSQLATRRRAAARNRALARLAREFPERYAVLYREERRERGGSS